MLDITNKTVQEISGFLNKTNDAERKAAYAGVAMAYSNSKISSIITRGEFKLNANDRYEIAELFYALNEVAVIDKENFINVINKFITFKLNVFYGKELMLTTNDVSGISYVFDEKMMSDVETNIKIVRTVFKLATTIIEDYK